MTAPSYFSSMNFLAVSLWRAASSAFVASSFSWPSFTTSTFA